ncbi:glycosyl hydrolase family 18 protein [Streptomyces sp. SL13]|uniref:chitinase n=1 Tax=Streptantibioticus silvisoli TaxID=2705255 RepID=A0AA90GXN5_9ACTN|nr:glycosyl hydrolase family 18 protein [Streptantibioticus silvisoli]MDI5963984.1 glycosyl hydrolase family 18 protein [Streptantibioticus silvisoli]MDI5970053.1 glycosyl hydrolase family 18 protein [Streptantibioticus silvisoli]
MSGRAPTLSLITAAVVSAAALGLGVSAVGAQAATANLTADPGFESGLGGWNCAASSGSAVSSPVHSGSSALKAVPSSSDDAQCSQTVSVQPDSSYTLSAWVQGSYVYLGASGTGGTDPSTWTPSASSWQQLTTSFTTGAKTTSVTVYLHGWYGEPAYFADDVALAGPAGSGGTPTPPPTSPPPTSPPPTSPPTGGAGVPTHAVTGYWQDFCNGATVQKLSDVNSAYDIIAVAFATATTTPGAVDFSLDSCLNYSDAQFKADITAAHAAGKKVVISVGGQNGTISVTDSASATNFANSVYALMQSYGFDGVDIDLENGINPTYMSQALHSLSSLAGSGLVVTMAPQTIDMLSASSDYLATALQIKDILTVVNTQYYNSGSMNGCDGGVYSEGTVDFITSMACTAIQAGLSPSQVGIGVPASSSAAGSGYVSPTVVNDALDCLTQGTSCGTFKPPTTWPTLRGAMTWSTNWDASNGNQFATSVGAHVHALS